jgi:hypothetical protein
MSWRVYLLMIPALLTVAVALSLAAVDATVTLECANVPTAQCPSGTSSGVLLISATDAIADTTTKGTLTFKNVDNSLKQAMAFRKDRAPAYKQVTWTAAETLAFKGGHEELPLRIWAVCTDAAGTCPALTAARQETLGEKMVAHVNGVLTRERTGIKLVPPPDGTLISDESGTPARTELKAAKGCAAFKLDAVRLKKFTEGALNIYIVHTVELSEGKASNFACTNFTDVAVVGATGSRDLILHEIGHMLALEDVWESRSAWGSDPEANFMRHMSETRKFFTEGQIFRMHLNQDSAINVLLKRHPSDKRWCESSPMLPCPKPNERVWQEP